VQIFLMLHELARQVGIQQQVRQFAPRMTVFDAVVNHLHEVPSQVTHGSPLTFAAAASKTGRTRS